MGLDPDLVQDNKRGEVLTCYPLTRTGLHVKFRSNIPQWQEGITQDAFIPKLTNLTKIGNSILKGQND